MRQISFSLTRDAFLNGSKDITRRYLSWDPEKFPKGTRLMAVNQCQGLKKGEQIKYGPIDILSNEPEPLDQIIKQPVRSDQFVSGWMAKTETQREGFPAWTTEPRCFVDFFCKANKCKPDDEIHRIAFRRVA